MYTWKSAQTWLETVRADLKKCADLIRGPTCRLKYPVRKTNWRKTKTDQWPMVPTVVNNGPRQLSTKKSMVTQVVWNSPNTHANIETNPQIYRPVGQSRSISAVGSIPPTGEHGRYRRSVRLHLRRNTVDRRSSIIDQDNFVIDSTDDTCAIFPPKFFSNFFFP